MNKTLGCCLDYGVRRATRLFRIDFAMGKKIQSSCLSFGYACGQWGVRGGMSLSIQDASLVGQINEHGEPVLLIFPKMGSGNCSDEHWGWAGPACLFSIGVCLATGKDGIAYPSKTANLGGTTPTDNAKANCAELAAPPVWLTMSPGPVDPSPANPTTFSFFPGATVRIFI
jgi:hypothetical protein